MYIINTVLLTGVGADVSTDGKWCYVVFWVVGRLNTRWGLLKKRLMEACPSSSLASGILYYTEMRPPKPPEVFLLKFCCNDRSGLLHGKFLLPLDLGCLDAAAVYQFCFAILLLILYDCFSILMKRKENSVSCFGNYGFWCLTLHLILRAV